MLSLNTNVNDLILQRTLYEGTFGLNYAIERMTTGYKVNHAKDNAAGYSIIEDLNTRISSMLQIQNNTEDGISLLSTAQGGLEEIETLLSRLRELTIQASNGTYDAQSREAMQAEADAIVAEIERLKNITEFNGIKLYERPADNTVSSINTTFSLINRSSTSVLDDENIIENNEIHSMMFTPQESNSSDLTTYLLSDEENPTSSDTFSLNQPTTSQIESTNSVIQSRAAPMMYSASPTSAENIEGSENFAASETRTITIDGVQYTVKNRQTTASTLSYMKNGTSGQVTFLGAYFNITAQSDVAHNVSLNGNYIYFYGGNEADTITTTSNSTYIYAYGQGGNDTIVGNGYGDNLHGGEGDDNIIYAPTNTGNNTYLYGDGGEDTITVNGSGVSGVYGGAENDIIHVYGDSNALIKGDDGDDKFYIYSGADSNTINGGSGTNTVELEQGTNTNKVNVVGSNMYSEEFNTGETKTLTINNIQYTVKNDNTSASTFIWDVTADGLITFKGNKFTIKGDENVAHNVKLTSSLQYFHGGNLNDKVEILANATEVYTYGGDDEIILPSARSFVLINTGEGDDKITSSSYIQSSNIFTGNGDDEVSLHTTYSNTSNYIDLGSDNDTISGKIINSVIIGGDATNTYSGTQQNTLFTDFNDSINNGTTVLFSANEIKDIVINGKTYTIQNTNSTEMNLVYSYNPVTGFVDFGGSYFNITAQYDVEHKVNLYGVRIKFYGGELNDEIVNYSYAGYSYGQGGNDKISGYNSDSYISGGAGNDVLISESYVKIDGNDGDDTIIINNGIASSVINGGSGNDSYELNAKTTVNDTSGNNIFHINADNTTINTGSGNDTFYIKSSNNTINAGAGDDYFDITGSTNNIDGGGGNDYYADETGTNNYTNVVVNPNSGKVIFSALDEVVVKNINGKDYTFTNTGAVGNTVSYNVNVNTNELTISGSDTEILCADNQAHNLIIKGDNNVINGGNLDDIITIASGSNNIVNGNTGNDILRNEDLNNSFFGGDDNDKIELIKSTNLEVNGGNGNNILNIESSNNTQVNAGTGNNTINISGSNNIVQGQNGNNTISISGTGNSLNAGSGNNILYITNNNNTVNLGGGNNEYNVSGDGNNLTVQNAVGDISINGSNNTITQTKGSNNVSIKGDLNNYTSTLGRKELDVLGNGNSITTGNEGDKVKLKGDSNTFETIGGSNFIEVIGNNNQIQGGDGFDNIKINGNSNTALGGDSDDKFVLGAGNGNIIDGEAGNKNTIINYAENTIYTNALDVTPQGFRANIKVGIGSSDDTYITTDISFNPILLSVDLSSQENALASLESIDDLIKSVQEQLLNIGASINRLQMALEEQDIRIQNMISTRSTLRDADIAEESSNYIRYQILQEASATLIASSRNLRKENVLGLLQSLKR